MTMNVESLRNRLPERILLVVMGFTLVLTAGFVGLVALLSGDTAGSNGRVPYYVLATAIAFIVALWRLDEGNVDGLTVLIASSGIALGAGILVAFATEGVSYGVRNPSELVSSHLIVYFLAAALICTGLGIWGLRHWREFASRQRI
ncbi:hypothetical protein ACLI4Q_16545 [Natrialbaceae archaeon A-CW1-1]